MKSNVELRKLQFIEDFLKVKNESLIGSLELLLKQERLKDLENYFSKPISKGELDDMLNKAESDAINGKVVSSEELRKKVKTWSRK